MYNIKIYKLKMFDAKTPVYQIEMQGRDSYHKSIIEQATAEILIKDLKLQEKEYNGSITYESYY